MVVPGKAGVVKDGKAPLVLSCLLAILCLEAACGPAVFEPPVAGEVIHTDGSAPAGVEVTEAGRELRSFRDTGELESWLEENDTDRCLYSAEEESSGHDCDDFARCLAKQAIDDGYYMWVQVLHHPYRRRDTNELLTTPERAHAVCSVFIGNDGYYIEPQTDEYWLGVVVD